jgi:hypothetical protein
MLWAFWAGGAIGLLLGLRFRVPRLLAALAAAAPACLVVMPFTDRKPMAAVVMAFALLGALQVGYLTGLILWCPVPGREQRDGSPGIPCLRMVNHPATQRRGYVKTCADQKATVAAIQSASSARWTAATAFASKARSSQIDQRRT